VTLAWDVCVLLVTSVLALGSMLLSIRVVTCEEAKVVVLSRLIAGRAVTLVVVSMSVVGSIIGGWLLLEMAAVVVATVVITTIVAATDVVITAGWAVVVMVGISVVLDVFSVVKALVMVR
jgi:hypothetical protein